MISIFENVIFIFLSVINKWVGKSVECCRSKLWVIKSVESSFTVVEFCCSNERWVDKSVDFSLYFSKLAIFLSISEMWVSKSVETC